MQSSMQTTFEGHLFVLSDNDSWDTLYGVVTSSYLTLYRDKACANSGKIFNRISIRGGKVTDFKNHVYDRITFGFTPTTAGNTFVFAVEDEDSKNDWIEQIARSATQNVPPPTAPKQRPASGAHPTYVSPNNTKGNHNRHHDIHHSHHPSDLSLTDSETENEFSEFGPSEDDVFTDDEDGHQSALMDLDHGDVPLPPNPEDQDEDDENEEKQASSAPNTSCLDDYELYTQTQQIALRDSSNNHNTGIEYNSATLTSTQLSDSISLNNSTASNASSITPSATLPLIPTSTNGKDNVNWLADVDADERADGLGVIRIQGVLLRHVDGKVYKERYCILRDWALEFYNAPFYPTAATPLPELSSQLNFLHLVGTWVSDVPESFHNIKHCFAIHTTLAGIKTFYFAAPDANTKRTWIQLILQHRAYIPTLPLIPTIPSYKDRFVHMDLNPTDDSLSKSTNLNASQAFDSTQPLPETPASGTGVNNQNDDDDDDDGTDDDGTDDDDDNEAESRPVNYVLGSIDKFTKKSNFLKATVSKKKRRFNLDGFDLDLTYISNRVIAMGFPSSGTEAYYRNDMREVVRFFETRHAGHYKIYNLCSERSYPKDSFFRVLHFPFDDHNPPAFQDLLFLVKDMCRWLRAHPNNMVGIHCKAGKGRTGLIISIILYYSDMWDTDTQALQYYATVRTKNQKGVTIPSQTRYVQMFYKYMCMSPLAKFPSNISLPPLRLKYIKSIIIEGENAGFDYFVVKCNGWTRATRVMKGALMSCPIPNANNYSLTRYENGCHISATEDCFPVIGDVNIEFLKVGLLGVKKERVFSFWFHTQFVECDGDILSMRRKEIDKANKKKGKYDFKVEVLLGTSKSTMKVPAPMPLEDGSSYIITEYSDFNPVPANSATMSALASQPRSSNASELNNGRTSYSLVNNNSTNNNHLTLNMVTNTQATTHAQSQNLDQSYHSVGKENNEHEAHNNYSASGSSNSNGNGNHSDSNSNITHISPHVGSSRSSDTSFTTTYKTPPATLLPPPPSGEQPPYPNIPPPPPGSGLHAQQARLVQEQQALVAQSQTNTSTSANLQQPPIRPARPIIPPRKAI